MSTINDIDLASAVSKFEHRKRPNFDFDLIGIKDGSIIFKSLNKSNELRTILAFVEGIEIGRSNQFDSQRGKGTITIPIKSFPLVSFPNEIRFASMDGIDMAPPIHVSSAVKVASWFGTGKIVCGPLRIRNGFVTATLENVINGSFVPSIIAEVNGAQRNVTITPLRRRDEGGSSCQLTLCLNAIDFTDCGTVIHIYTLPDMIAIASANFNRVDDSALLKTVLRLESQINQLSIRTRIDANENRRLLEDKVKENQDFLDSMLEYFVALIHDRVATSTRAEPFLESPAVSADELRRFANIGTKSGDDILVTPICSIDEHPKTYDASRLAVERAHCVPALSLSGVAGVVGLDLKRSVARIEALAMSYVGRIDAALFLVLDDEEVVIGHVSELRMDESFSIIFSLPTPRIFETLRFIMTRPSPGARSSVFDNDAIANLIRIDSVTLIA